MEFNNRPMGMDEDDSQNPFVMPLIRQSVPPAPPRRSMRSNLGVAPQFYGNPVQHPARRSRQPIQRRQMVDVPLSSTNPFLQDILEMERTEVSLTPNVNVIRRREVDAQSTTSSIEERKRKELKLRDIQLQMEVNEMKMRQLKLQRESTELEMELLDDDLEEGEIVSVNHDHQHQDVKRWLEFSDVELSSIDDCDHHQQQHYVPTPKPRKGLANIEKPKEAVPNVTVPDPPPPPVFPAQPSTVDNSVQTLAAAIVQAVSSQNRVSERFIARQSGNSKLPLFGGNPLEWPIFQQQYQRSTLDCGFSRAQNMQRLEKSLRGDARKAVQGLMIVPDNADKVMEKLEQRFGKPRYVIEALISTAKKVPTPKEDNIVSLLDFSNAISNLVTTVDVLKAKEHLQNPQLMSELVGKLPTHLKLDWGKVVCKKDQVSLVDLSTFVEEVAEAVSAVSTPKFKMKDEPRRKERGEQETFYANANDEGKPKTGCAFCEEKEHKSFKCPSFLKMNINQRWRMAKQKKACFSCLNVGHQTSKCSRQNPCGVDGCKRRHSKLLHSPTNVNLQTTDGQDDGDNGKEDNHEPEVNTHASQLRKVKSVLLRVAPVKIFGPNGVINTHALLDEGSTVSMISAEMADKLGLDGVMDPLVLMWTDAQSQRDKTSKRVSFEISSGDGGKRYRVDDVRTMANLNLPAHSINVKDMKKRWKHLEACSKLLDVENARPQLLIGQDNIGLSVAREVIEGPPNAPIATRTRLGWVLHGPTNKYRSQVNTNHSFTCHEEADEVQQLVKESFKLDSIGIQDRSCKPRSKEDELALKMMEKRTCKIDGRWETTLLWRSEPVQFPNSYSAALRRLNYLEHKMGKDSSFKMQYCERIKYYLEKGYARILHDDEAKEYSPKTWFLPHFGAVHPNKPGKVRIVFDAAAKVDGVSLNSMLLTGPDLLTSLPGVLIKFRERRIAFTGDIGDMFHQVRIRPEDRMSQRFLWRDVDGSNVKVLQMEVMIFGASCSPFCSQYIKNKNALEYKEDFPEAVEAIIYRHYVDDYLDSADSVGEAAMLIEDVKYVHSQGGFNIRKWITNNEELTALIPIEDRAETTKNLAEWSEIPVERVLGLHWDPVKDDFTFKLNRDRIGEDILKCEARPTKRQILRLMMLIFDPLGFLGFFTVKARMLLQAVWKSKIGWDDELGTELFKIWKKWIRDLPLIAGVKIPRCYSFNASTAENLQLHIFADASESAYAAVAYLRVEKNDEAYVSLIMSKTRVAPLKPVSVPRLELQASLIAARLGIFVKKELGLNVNRVIHWTDSRTVLAWVRSEDKRFHQYVSNRVGEIHEVTEVSSWRWVPTKHNVADDATRNGKSDFSSASRWWTGPDFLKLPEEEWPVEKAVKVEETELEIKPELLAATFFPASEIIPNASRYSSFMKYLRITAWILRAVNNFKSTIDAEAKFQQHELTMSELKKAEQLVCKKSQEESFPEELKLLANGKPLKKGNRIAHLSPFIDEIGVMRMSSRTGAYSESPIILEPSHPFTKLLIMRMHVWCGHQGRETVANELRQRFCILNLKTAVRRSWNDCRICEVRRAMPRNPIMAPLPEFRTEKPPRPFTITGMDYFGPIEVVIGRRHEKRYGVLFTCMNVRAVHLEIAHSLSTDSCVLAIRRFSSIRGQPQVLYSDNGTNLRGADTELKRALNDLDQEHMQSTMSTLGIEWHFIPPLSPHMGGTWERLVRSVKVAMRSALSSCRIPKDEVLQTIFAEAAAVVNSRPLTEVSIDPDDKEALTPFHFLIGSSSHKQPPGVFVKEDGFSRKQWRISQFVADQFWKRWVKEYLPTLQRRSKWRNVQPEVKVGAVVLVTDPGQPRSSWPLGKIVATFPGKDGVVRVADVKTSTGTYRRPVVKLAVLDVDERSSSPGLELGGKHVAEKADEE